MRGVVLTALAGLLAVFVVASPKPASALPAASAFNYSHTNADLIEVGKKWKKRYYRGGYRYRPYGYYRRPYYRSYNYYRPYYRPYYRNRPYYRRPGVSLWFGW